MSIEYHEPKTLDAALKANAEILKNAAAMLGVDQKKDAAKLLFDVFFRLIPTHLAIAPPATKAKTGIAGKYVELCCCDNSPTVYECCGPEIRLPTVRDRIVGASMGGTIAVAAAAPVGADAVVDLSGPVRWPPYDTNAVLPTLTMPTLLAVNESDDAQAHAVMQAGTTQVPATHKLFVSAPAGHGWDLVMSRTDPSAPPTALGRLVADWIAGRYPAG